MRIHPSPAASNPLPLDNTASPDANSGTDPAGFSSLLRQTQATASPPPPMPMTAPAPAPAPKPTTTAAAPKPAAATAENQQAKAPEPTQGTNGQADASPDASEAAEASNGELPATTSAQPKSRARAADAATRPGGAKGSGHTAAEAADTVAAPPATDTRETAAATTRHATTDPGFAPWMAAMQLRSAAKSGEAPMGKGSNTSSVTDAALSGDGATAANTAAGHANEFTATPSNDARADTAGAHFAALAADALAATPLGGAPADTRSADGASLSTRAIEPGGALAAFAPTGGSTSVAAADAPAAVSIPTPVDSPDFAQVLGVQMSVLAKDGVQHAELHLNPADMGPVSVQIVMDGTQARIDFGADMAATRQAIEAGLPQLASALSSAGFTLAGGGVSQHSQPRGDGQEGRRGQGEGSGADGRRAVSTEGVARASTAARRIVTNGGVDLYA